MSRGGLTRPSIIVAPVPVGQLQRGDWILLPSGAKRQIAQLVDYEPATVGAHTVPGCRKLVYTNGHLSRGYSLEDSLLCERWSDHAHTLRAVA